MNARTIATAMMFAATLCYAELLRPIDPQRAAEINGQAVNSRQLTLPTVNVPQYQPRQLSRELPLVPVRVRDVKTVQTPRREAARQLAYPIRPADTRPTQNFTHRSASVPGRLPVARAPVPSQRAPVSQRVIEATTPAGEAELVEQLRWFPKRVH
ncbi:MAG: hypothetical protein RMM51_10265 [Verrucomicrobiae bacterium]|nr:hypothetical protein [Verrucomicrobiae bacterium]